MAIKITKGNIDDRTPVAELSKKLKGSIYTDLFKLITGIRKIMKTILSI